MVEFGSAPPLGRSGDLEEPSWTAPKETWRVLFPKATGVRHDAEWPLPSSLGGWGEGKAMSEEPDPGSTVSEAGVRRSGMLGHALCLNIKGLSWLSGHRVSTLAARLGWGWGGVSVKITSAGPSP